MPVVGQHLAANIYVENAIFCSANEPSMLRLVPDGKIKTRWNKLTTSQF